MEISRKLEYALRMLCEVARSSSQGVISVREVAEMHDIPYSFARTIQHEMVRSGLLATTRGPRGGMMLAVDARDTTLLDIVEAVDGPLRFGGSAGDAGGESTSELGRIAEGVENLLVSYLRSVTLHQIAVEHLVPVIGGSYRVDLVPAECL